MKIVLPSIIALGLMIGTAQADVFDVSTEDFSATTSVSTDYRFRGISMTQTNPSIGGVLMFDNGLLYAGAEGNSVDFGPFDGPSVELSGFVGFTPTLSFMNGSVGADVGVEYTSYHGSPGGFPDLDYWEYHGGLNTTVGPVALAGDVSYAPDFLGTSSEALTYEGRAGVEVMNNFTVSGTLGQTNLDSLASPFDSWVYYDVAIGTEVAGFDLSIAYVGNDINTVALPTFARESIDDGVVFSVSRTF